MATAVKELQQRLDNGRALQPVKPDDFKRPAGSAANLERLAGAVKGQIAAALPKALAGIAPRLVRCLLTECRTAPALLECSAHSLIGGLIAAGQLGLEIGGPTGKAYLIPFKGSAQLVIGYKGLIDLATRSGRVRGLRARIVRQGDQFELEYGTAQVCRHVPDLRNVGAPIGYYAIAEFTAGGSDFEYMSKAECELHRDRFALSKRGPWLDHFDEMAKKTVLRKLCKRLPLSAEFAAAVAMDERAEAGELQSLPEVAPADAEPAHDPADPEQPPAADGELFAAGVGGATPYQEGR